MQTVSEKWVALLKKFFFFSFLFYVHLYPHRCPGYARELSCSLDILCYFSSTSSLPVNWSHTYHEDRLYCLQCCILTCSYHVCFVFFVWLVGFVFWGWGGKNGSQQSGRSSQRIAFSYLLLHNMIVSELRPQTDTWTQIPLCCCVSDLYPFSFSR